jgi:hypothetical protein
VAFSVRAFLCLPIAAGGGRAAAGLGNFSLAVIRSRQDGDQLYAWRREWCPVDDGGSQGAGFVAVAVARLRGSARPVPGTVIEIGLGGSIGRVAPGSGLVF